MTLHAQADKENAGVQTNTSDTTFSPASKSSISSTSPSFNNVPCSGMGPRAKSASEVQDMEGSSRRVSDKPLFVLKVGTSTLITAEGGHQRVQLTNVARLVELISELKEKGYHVVLVSSGAVGMGCIKLGLKTKPKVIGIKQAVAAAGQSQLMRMYEDLFSTMHLNVAQLLINQSDFMEKEHWMHVKQTIQECLNLGVVPIINENDSTNTQELRFGDNDNLAALTAVQLEADGLFLFTDVDYLYTANPRCDPSAKPLRVVREPWSLQVDTRSEGSGMGTGGMETKIAAARTVSTAGIPCGLINGQHPGRIHSFLDYGILQNKAPDAQAAMPEGTFFMAMQEAQNVNDTERWILSLPTPGELEVDDEAARALAENGSLKPVSITQCQGSFTRDEAAKIMHRGSEIGRAIMNFDSDELNRLKGRQSNDFLDILGYAACSEACHQSSVILTTDPEALREIGQGDDNIAALKA